MLYQSKTERMKFKFPTYTNIISMNTFLTGRLQWLSESSSSDEWILQVIFSYREQEKTKTNIEIFIKKSNSVLIRRVTFVLTLTDFSNAMFRASVSEQR